MAMVLFFCGLHGDIKPLCEIIKGGNYPNSPDSSEKQVNKMMSLKIRAINRHMQYNFKNKWDYTINLYLMP